MENNRALGPGALPAELLEYSPEGVLEELTSLFNKCLEKVKCQQNGKQDTYCLYSEKERFQASEKLQRNYCG
jgi:hypothetical protein